MNHTDIKKIAEEQLPLLLFIIPSIAIALFAIFIPGQCIYDEQHYLVNTKSFASGVTQWWDFANHRGPTGPGYAWIHAAIWNIIPTVTCLRLSNAVLLITSAVFVSRIKPFNWTAGAVLLNFPGIWVSGALALTEVYSIFLLSIALWISSKYEKHRYHWIILGALISFACFSRQTLLAVAPAFFIVSMSEFLLKRSKDWIPMLLGGAALILIPLPMFLSWGGLLPVDDIAHEQITSQGNFSLMNMSYSLSYMIILLTALTTEIRNEVYGSKWILLGCLVLGGCLEASLDYEYLPMKSTVIQLLGQNTSSLIAGVFPAMSIGLTLFLVTRFFLNPIEHIKKVAQESPIIIFSALCVILIVLSNGAITHQFSSRYLTVCAPFLAVLLKSKKITLFAVLGLTLLNLTSVLSYL